MTMFHQGYNIPTTKRLTSSSSSSFSFLLSSSSSSLQNDNNHHDNNNDNNNNHDDDDSNNATIVLSLTKPFGFILEEIQEGQPCGVYVKEINTNIIGSAVQYKDLIVNTKIIQIQNHDVTNKTFDEIMNLIVQETSSSSTEGIQMTFSKNYNNNNNKDDNNNNMKKKKEYVIGDVVTIRVIRTNSNKNNEKNNEKNNKNDKNDDLLIQAKVGDNLRKVLLQQEGNQYEVYQGMKEKLTNCGGAGQCTFCAVDFIDDNDNDDSIIIMERSDYENKKLSKYPNARLSCLHTIQGPLTIKKTIK